MNLLSEDAKKRAIDSALSKWRQGDVSLDAEIEFIHLADLSNAHSPASLQLAKEGSDPVEPASSITTLLEDTPGVVVLTQTCDLIRSCEKRPYVSIAPVAQLDTQLVEEVRLLKRPAFAYIPAISERGFVADLDRIMTVEKAVVARWTRVAGCETDKEAREFARAISRKFSRFAFPNDFVSAIGPLQAHLSTAHRKNTCEGAHLTRIFHQFAELWLRDFARDSCSRPKP